MFVRTNSQRSVLIEPYRRDTDFKVITITGSIDRNPLYVALLALF